MKKNIILITMCILISVFLLSCVSSKKQITENWKNVKFVAKLNTVEAQVRTNIYGNLILEAESKDFIASGINWGDIVTVKFSDKSLDLPVVPTFSYVFTGEPAVIVARDDDGKPTGNVILAINMGNFTTTYGIADLTINEDRSYYWTPKKDITLPLTFEFTIKEKFGYMQRYILNDLKKTNNRADYPYLTDEQFANFREVKTSGMHNLYRSSSPVENSENRNKYADEACRKAGVNVILNLGSTRDEVLSHEDYKGTYYSGCENVLYIKLGVDFSSTDFRNGLAIAYKYMTQHKGKYLLECGDGMTRTAFACSILECLMGASAEEVVSDYMTSYYNYYKVEKGSEKYKAIVKNNIIQILEQNFDIDDLYSANLAKEAEEYLYDIGLNRSEVATLRLNLSR